MNIEGELNHGLHPPPRWCDKGQADHRDADWTEENEGNERLSGEPRKTKRQRRAPISAQGNALGLRRKNLQALKGRANPCHNPSRGFICTSCLGLARPFRAWWHLVRIAQAIALGWRSIARSGRRHRAHSGTRSSPSRQPRATVR